MNFNNDNNLINEIVNYFVNKENTKATSFSPKKKKENTKGIKKFITKNLQADMTKTWLISLKNHNKFMF